MVLIDIKEVPIAFRQFEAEVWSIDSSDTRFKYTAQPVVNISHVRQGVKIKRVEESVDAEDDEVVLTPNKSIRMGFEFIYQPEFVTVGSHLIIVENNLKLYGYIKKLIN
jgi:GTPase